MSTCSRLLALAVLASAVSRAGELPGLGEPLTAAEVEAIDFVVMPDGEGLPPGSGTARDGAVVYRAYCLSCHGETGADGINDPLVGGHGTITGPRPEKTVGSYWPYATTLFDYVRRAMPYQSPGSLSDDEVYALTAYILFLNGIVDESARLDAGSLPSVRMPNAGNFVWAHTPAE